MNVDVRSAVWWGFLALWCGAMAVYGVASDRPNWAIGVGMVVYGFSAYTCATFAGKAAK